MDNFVHSTAIIDDNVIIGKNTKIWHYTHVRGGVIIGESCILGKGVYIDFDVKIGNNVKIQNNSSIYHGSIIEDGVFIGPHVCLTNDKFPRAINENGSLKSDSDWQVGTILIRRGASIGAGSIILPNITIGKFSLVGAGSIVTNDVKDYTLVYGNPAKVHGKVNRSGEIIKRF
ncbi:MAG: N-acetyltransferase [Cyanobacteria bacterium]|nr:N-acetyltransferase [Cyanobacteriota bacterium]